MRNARRRDFWAWMLILAFFAGFAWLCKDRFHMVYPGYYIVLSLAASIILIVAMWRLYVGSPLARAPEADSIAASRARR